MSNAKHITIGFRPRPVALARLRALSARTGLDVTTLCRLAVHEFLEAEYSAEAIFALNAAAQQANLTVPRGTTPATP